jgi:hypothetical protein
MEAICSFETSVDSQRTTRRHIPEDNTLHNHRCENLKSIMLELFEISTWERDLETTEMSRDFFRDKLQPCCNIVSSFKLDDGMVIPIRFLNIFPEACKFTIIRLLWR